MSFGNTQLKISAITNTPATIFDPKISPKIAGNPEKNPSTWAKDTWELAKKQGITDGSGPHGLCTREEVVALIERSR